MSIEAIMTMVSRRDSASRAELEWMVDIEPSWPVFIAWSMSRASAPRTSPTRIRSGRMRRLLRSSWRIVSSPLPSTLGGRCSNAMTCGWSDDGVDAAAVGEPRVDHRVQAVDVPPRGGDHAADRLQELVLVLEPDIGLGQDAASLDEDLVRTVDHDLAHRAVVKQAVQGSIADRGAKDDVREG